MQVSRELSRGLMSLFVATVRRKSVYMRQHMDAISTCSTGPSQEVSWFLTMPRSRRVKTAAALVIVDYWLRVEERKRRKKRMWVRDWIDRRREYGAYTNLLNELKIEDSLQFRNFIRMSAVELEDLLCLVGPKIQKQDTVFRESIQASERLMVTLRFLATGKFTNIIEIILSHKSFAVFTNSF